VSEPRKFWMRWRVRVGYPVAVIYWFLARPEPRSVLIGGIVAAFGLIVRAAAAGHLRKDRALATSGVYSRTRNPLYLGSAFLAAGFVIAGQSWWAGLLVGLYFAAFYYAVMRNEEEDLRKRFGADYERYAASVPLFFPRFSEPKSHTSLPPDQTERFSWALYRRNREYRALVGTVAGLGVVWLRAWVRTKLGY